MKLVFVGLLLLVSIAVVTGYQDEITDDSETDSDIYAENDNDSEEDSFRMPFFRPRTSTTMSIRQKYYHCRSYCGRSGFFCLRRCMKGLSRQTTNTPRCNGGRVVRQGNSLVCQSTSHPTATRSHQCPCGVISGRKCRSCSNQDSVNCKFGVAPRTFGGRVKGTDSESDSDSENDDGISSVRRCNDDPSMAKGGCQSCSFSRLHCERKCKPSSMRPTLNCKYISSQDLWQRLRTMIQRCRNYMSEGTCRRDPLCKWNYWSGSNPQYLCEGDLMKAREYVGRTRPQALKTGCFDLYYDPWK